MDRTLITEELKKGVLKELPEAIKESIKEHINIKVPKFKIGEVVIVYEEKRTITNYNPDTCRYEIESDWWADENDCTPLMKFKVYDWVKTKNHGLQRVSEIDYTSNKYKLYSDDWFNEDDLTTPSKEEIRISQLTDEVESARKNRNRFCAAINKIGKEIIGPRINSFKTEYCSEEAVVRETEKFIKQLEEECAKLRLALVKETDDKIQAEALNVQLNDTIKKAQKQIDVARNIDPVCETCNWTNIGCLKILDKWMCHSCIDTFVKTHRWTSFEERKPTEADFDNYGDIELIDESSNIVIRRPDKGDLPKEFTHWRRTSLPHFKPNDRVMFEKFYIELKGEHFKPWMLNMVRTREHYIHEDVQNLWKAWKASKK